MAMHRQDDSLMEAVCRNTEMLERLLGQMTLSGNTTQRPPPRRRAPERAGVVDRGATSDVNALVRETRAAAGALGRSPAANSVNDSSHARRIVSTALQQAIFTNGKVDGIPASLLVDTGSAVTIIHRRLWERGRGGANIEAHCNKLLEEPLWLPMESHSLSLDR